MAEPMNCPTCGSLFNYTGLREVCAACAHEEETLYETVYKFLRRRENRAANIERIVEVTGVTQEMLHKWVRKGRLQPALFPNLGYPCDRCGALTSTGKICDKCSKEIQADLQMHEAAAELRSAVETKDKGVYHAQTERK